MKNPEDLAGYRWSSHQAYLGENGAVAVDTALVLAQFGSSVGHARRAYRKFIEDGGGGHEERYHEAIDPRFLGDEKFVQRITERAPQAEIRPGGRSLPFEKLLHAIAKVHGYGPKDLTASGRQRAWTKPRAQLAYVARAWCNMKAIEIARQLNRDASMGRPALRQL